MGDGAGDRFWDEGGVCGVAGTGVSTGLLFFL